MFAHIQEKGKKDHETQTCPYRTLRIRGICRTEHRRGGIALLTGTFAQGIPVVWLQGTPFTDYTIPGLALAIVVGGGMAVAAVTIFIQREWAVLISAIAGIFMVGFEVVEAASVDSKAGDGLPLMAGLQVF